MSLRIDEQGPRLRASVGWFTPRYVLALVGVLVLDAHVVALGVLGADILDSLLDDPMAIAIAVGIALLVPGVHYGCAAVFLNRSVVTVEGDTLSSSVTPVPWPRASARVSLGDIERLYLHEVATPRKTGITYSYALMAVLGSGGEVRLVPDLDDREGMHDLLALLQAAISSPAAASR